MTDANRNDDTQGEVTGPMRITCPHCDGYGDEDLMGDGEYGCTWCDGCGTMTESHIAIIERHKPTESEQFASGGIMWTEPPAVLGAYETSGPIINVRSEAPVKVYACPDLTIPPPIVIRIAHTLVVPNPDKDA